MESDTGRPGGGGVFFSDLFGERRASQEPDLPFRSLLRLVVFVL